MEMTRKQQLADWLHRSQGEAKIEVVRAEYALEQARLRLQMLETATDVLFSQVAQTVERR